MPEHEWSKELGALRADVMKLRSDLTGVAEAIKDIGKAQIDQAKDSLASLADALRDDLRRGLEGARDGGRKSVESVEHQIGKRPVLSVMAALAVGVLLGKLCWTGGRR